MRGAGGMLWEVKGEYRGIQAQGVVVMTMTWVWTDGVQLMMNNYARFFFKILLFFPPPSSCCENCDLAPDFLVFGKTRNDFDEWRLNGAAESPVRHGNNIPLRRGRCHFVICALRVMCI